MAEEREKMKRNIEGVRMRGRNEISGEGNIQGGR